MNDNQILRSLVKSFELDMLLQTRQLGGFANKNYVLTTSRGTFVAKILQEHSTSDAEAEAEYLEFLVRNHISFVPFLKLPGTNMHVWTSTEARAVVMPFISGRIPSQITSDLNTIGEGLAKLHSVSGFEKLPKRLAWMRSDYLPKAIKLIHQKFGNAMRFEEAYRKLNFNTEELPVSIMHGDLGPNNCLITDKGVVMLDSEEIMVGPSIADLAMSVLYSCYTDGKHDQFDLQKFNELLKGYNSVRPLTNTEIDLFPEAMRFSGLTISAWNKLDNDEWGELYWMRDLDNFEKYIK